ncbi:hypothetical protein ACHAWF_015369 [Thalassiosira exigua]
MPRIASWWGGGGVHKKGAGTFTLERLKAMGAECIKVTLLLEEYYFGKQQAKAMLMEFWLDLCDFGVPPSATIDDTLPRHRAEKLADTMACALATEAQSGILSWPDTTTAAKTTTRARWGTRGSRSWHVAGMDFVFQNTGIGGNCGNSHLNQHFCLGMNMLPDMDVVHYSWTYFEHGNEIVSHEDLIRWAQLLRKRPLVHGFRTGMLDNLMTLIYTSPNTTSYMPDKTPTQRCAKYGYKGLSLRTAFEKGGHDYKVEKTQEDNPIDRFGPWYVGDGYHNMTWYTEDKEQRTSLDVVMRNWGSVGAVVDVEPKAFAGTQPPHTQVERPPSCLNYELETCGGGRPRVVDPEDLANPLHGEAQNSALWHLKRDPWGGVGKVHTKIFKQRVNGSKICSYTGRCGAILFNTLANNSVVFRLHLMKVLREGGGIDDVRGKSEREGAVQFGARLTGDEVPPYLAAFPAICSGGGAPDGGTYLMIKSLDDTKAGVKISHITTP